LTALETSDCHVDLSDIRNKMKAARKILPPSEGGEENEEILITAKS
jgi:hypothetical protein